MPRKAENTIRESEERYRSLFNNMTEGFALHEIITDQNGRPCDYRFIDVNPSFERLTGLKRTDVLGKRVLEVLPDNDPHWVETYGKVALTGEPARFEDYSTALGRWYEVFAYRPAPGQFAVIFRDVTEAHGAAEAVRNALRESEQKEKEVRSLLAGARAILEHHRFAESARTIFTTCKDLIGAAAGYVALLSADGKENEVVFLDSGGLECSVDPSLPMPVRGLREQAYRTLRPVFENNFPHSQWMEYMPNGHTRLDNVLFAPLVIQGAAIGLLGLANKPGGFTEEDAQRAMGFSELAAIALTNKRAEEALREAKDHLETRVKERTAELEQSNRTLQEEVAVRKRAEEAVKAERQRFNDVLETLPAYLVLLTPDYHVPFANRFFRERFGESHGRRCFEYLFHRTDPCEICHTYKVLKTMQPIEWEWVGPDGHNYYIYDFPFTDTDGAPLIMEMGIDITERKAAEAELEKYRHHLEDLVKERTRQLEAANTQLQAEIAERKQAEAELHKVNRTLRALSNSNQAMMHATDEAELLKQTCKIVVEDCGHAMVWIGYAEQDKGKTVRPVAHAGLDQGYLETLRVTWADTERGRGPTGTAIRTGKPACCLNMLTDPKFKPWRSEAVKRGYASSLALPLMAEGKAFGAMTIYSSQPEAFSDDEVKLLDELGGDLAYGIAAIRAQTERKQAEDSLRRSEEELRALNETLEHRVQERTQQVTELADRLRALAAELTQTEQRERRRMAAILHDHIQQLLVAAQMQLHLLSDEPHTTTGKTAMQKAETYVEEAIEASRSLAVELCPPALHSVGLAAALDWLASRMWEKHQFKIEVSASKRAEPAREDTRMFLFEAVRELVFNALKHSGVNRARIQMRCEKGNWTKIVVEDKGCGFDLKAVESGKSTTGKLGLFSILQRLRYIGGRMEVKSAPGRGARITLWAPMKEKEAEKAAAPTPSAPAPPERHEGAISVLLVDDHAVLREGLRGILHRHKDIVVVGEAGDGEQAIELARRLQPIVILMDLSMPKMNGLEATRIISREMPSVKIIGLSLHEDANMIEAMKQAGAVGYLPKGSRAQTVLAAIRSAAERKLPGPGTGSKNEARSRISE